MGEESSFLLFLFLGILIQYKCTYENDGPGRQIKERVFNGDSQKDCQGAQAVAETAAVKSAAVEKAPAAVKEEKPAAKTTRKASGKKAPAAKKAAAPKISLTLQYLGKELTQEAMVDAVKAQWTGADIKTLELYVKPEDSAVYYVVNGESTGKIEL